MDSLSGLRIPMELPVLSQEALYENSTYTTNFVDLKARLNTLEQPSLPPRKLKEQEQFFFEAINGEVLKVNNVCTKGVLEIEDAMRYLSRKLSEPDLGQEHASILLPECDTLLSSICQLEQYVKLCETSFAYVMKKHDSIVGSASSAWFETLMQDEYFTNIHFRALVIQLGNLYAIIRKKLHGAERDTTPGRKQQEKVKSYWVKKDDLLKVQGWILRHMPLSEIHKQKIKERATDEDYEVDPAISVTSIYFDGPKFELYNNFVHALPDSKLVRVSWNGEERTDVRISFQSQSGIPETVPIKYKHIGPFLAGEWRFDQYTQKLLGKGKISSEASREMISSAESIHKVIKEKALRSVLRVSLDRYEFESEDGSVHVRLDTYPTMVKETGGGRRWNRDTHASHIKGREKASLHLHLLRVTTWKNDIDWISELLDLGLACVVPSKKHPFDYFLYGVAKFYTKQLDTVPSWMPAIHEFTHKASKTRRLGGPGLDSLTDIYNSVSDFHSVSAYSEWTDSSEEDETEGMLTLATSPPSALHRSGSVQSIKSSGASTPTSPASAAVTPTLPTVAKKLSNGNISTPQSQATTPTTTPLPTARSNPEIEMKASPEVSRDKPEAITPPPTRPHLTPSQPSIQSPSQPPQPPPPQATKPDIEDLLPVRQTVNVEPKTFFSNERTLLQWMNAIVVLATLSITLIGVGDSKARISGFILLPVSIIFGLYALGMYHLRLRAIAERKNSRVFQDSIGPYVLVIVFLIALVLAAVIPSLHTTTVGDNPEARDYPFVPAHLPYAPDSYHFSAPLPLELFPLSTRGAGVAAVMGMLATIGKNPEMKVAFAVPPLKEDNTVAASESILVVTNFLTALSNSSVSYNTPYKLRTKGEETELEIHSDLPGFDYLNDGFPKHNSQLVSGKEGFALSLDCKDASFYYKSTIYKAITPRDWKEAEQYFPNLTTVLNMNSISFHVPFTAQGKSERKWTQDVMIADSPATISLALHYNCSVPTCAEGSVSETAESARIQIYVSEKFRNVETFKTARVVLEAIIKSQWVKWPATC